MEWVRRKNPYHRAWLDPAFPYVLTTYRLTEHHTSGGMSRWLGWLSELQPEMFCEVSPELAEEKGLTNGGWATITTARAEIEARVLVTRRLRPLRLNGRVVHQIGLPYHWGPCGIAKGDSANDLISFVADPNVSIQESKAFTGNIEPGRRSRHAAAPRPASVETAGRDLAAVGARPIGKHGLRAARTEQGEET
jgi:formate dehydrogenase major subunit